MMIVSVFEYSINPYPYNGFFLSGQHGMAEVDRINLIMVLWHLTPDRIKSYPV